MEVAQLLGAKVAQGEDQAERFRSLLSLAYRSYAQRRGVGELTASEAAILEEGREWLLKEEARLKAEAAKEGTELRYFITYRGWWRQTAGWEPHNAYHVVVVVPPALEAVLNIHAAAQSAAAQAERAELRARREANLRDDVLQRHLRGEDILRIVNSLELNADVVAAVLEAATKETTYKDTVLAAARSKALQLGNKGMVVKDEAKLMERRIKEDLQSYRDRIRQRERSAEMAASSGAATGIDLAGTWPGEESEERAVVTPRFHKDGSMTVEKLIGKE